MKSPRKLIFPPSELSISVGKYRIELAKMIGITPDWFTFNGM